jgi:hypothetical protein
MRTDGQMEFQKDITKLIVAFHSYANRLKRTTNGICRIGTNGGGTFFNERINVKQ